MRSRITLLLLSLLLCCSACDWVQFGSAGTRTGSTGDSGPAVATATASLFASQATTGQAVISNGRVYVARDGLLTAIDATSGDTAWTATLPMGSTVGGTPAIDTASSTIFVVVAGASNPLLVGYDTTNSRNCNAMPHTCAPIFQADLGSVVGPATPPLVDGEKVIAAGAGSVYAFDSSGQTNCSTVQATQVCTPLWSYPTNFSAGGIGPMASNGNVFVTADIGLGFGLRALNESNGSVSWTGSTVTAPAATPSVGNNGTVFVPVGSVIDAFPIGCSAVCPPTFTLDAQSGDASGSFLATPIVDSDGQGIYAANSNGRLYMWPSTGCGAQACQPTAVATANAPVSQATAFAQSGALINTVVYVEALRAVSGVDHATLLAFGETDLHPISSWDLGTTGLPPGIATVSAADGRVYAPTSTALMRIGN